VRFTCLVDDFVQSLLLLPSETEIISDSVYANSQTLDGRRFAEEFVRRRKLADKGVLQGGSGTPGSAMDGGKSAGGAGDRGGWSEVAKKGPAGQSGRGEEAGSAAFKVVAAKKKGKK
jgi:PERQ amino acid-rich with GYF domain-containing protein